MNYNCINNTNSLFATEISVMFLFTFMIFDLSDEGKEVTPHSYIL